MGGGGDLGEFRDNFGLDQESYLKIPQRHPPPTPRRHPPKIPLCQLFRRWQKLRIMKSPATGNSIINNDASVQN